MKEIVPNLKALVTPSGERLDIHLLLQAPYEDISEAADQIPAAIGWLGYQRAMMTQRLILAEQAWKKAEAKQYFEMKSGGFVDQGWGEKQPSEEALKRVILLTPQVDKACAEFALLKKHFEWISSSINALQAKLELVRSSEATRRMEHASDRKGIVG